MILVAGATGMLGGEIARRLLADGRDVRILVRAGSDYQALADAGAEPVMGDLKDAASLDAACAGVDTLVTTANSARRFPPDTVESVDLEGNARLVQAARAAGVEHVVFVSANGARPDDPVPFMAAKGQTEQRLAESGMAWTILAPEPFMEVWIGMLILGPALSGREVVYVGSGERRHSWVSASDVAAFAAGSVGNPAARHRRLVIGGPEALSIRDAKAVFERVVAHPIPERSVPPETAIEGMPATVVGLLTGLDMYDSPIPMDDLAAEFGVTLTRLEEFARRSLTVPG